MTRCFFCAVGEPQGWVQNGPFTVYFCGQCYDKKQPHEFIKKWAGGGAPPEAKQ